MDSVLYYIFKDVCITNSFGRQLCLQKICLLSGQKAVMFADQDNKNNVFL